MTDVKISGSKLRKIKIVYPRPKCRRSYKKSLHYVRYVNRLYIFSNNKRILLSFVASSLVR